MSPTDHEKPLGRLKPPDRRHIALYPLATLIEDPTSALVVPPWGVVKGLGLPSWWKTWDQGSEGACVGFGSSAMMSITNARRYYLTTGKGQAFRYMARWLYFESQKVDEWPGGAYEGYQSDGEFYEGTSVRASCDVLCDVGHRRVVNRVGLPPDPTQGIDAVRWAVTTDEIRAAIFADLAVSIGVDWYGNFDSPSSVPITSGRNFSSG